YLRGEGVTQDYLEALKWCRLAAKQGNVNAQSNLGLMYGQGKGITQDYQQAVKWYRLAAK
ncbi:MAG: tetratricopeptide repeat protein, partial [Nitrosomonadaceae bacterium]